MCAECTCWARLYDTPARQRATRLPSLPPDSRLPLPRGLLHGVAFLVGLSLAAPAGEEARELLRPEATSNPSLRRFYLAVADKVLREDGDDEEPVAGAQGEDV